MRTRFLKWNRTRPPGAGATEDAVKTSFDAFRQDPEWIKAKDSSEASFRILVDGGVTSLFLDPLPFSGLQ